MRIMLWNTEDQCFTPWLAREDRRRGQTALVGAGNAGIGVMRSSTGRVGLMLAKYVVMLLIIKEHINSCMHF